MGWFLGHVVLGSKFSRKSRVEFTAMLTTGYFAVFLRLFVFVFDAK